MVTAPDGGSTSVDPTAGPVGPIADPASAVGLNGGGFGVHTHFGGDGGADAGLPVSEGFGEDSSGCGSQVACDLSLGVQLQDPAGDVVAGL